MIGYVLLLFTENGITMSHNLLFFDFMLATGGFLRVIQLMGVQDSMYKAETSSMDSLSRQV